MKKIKIIAGITWAIIGLVMIIILFPGLTNFSTSLASLKFMKINPHYTGGEAGMKYINEGCTLEVRKPVFDGLLTERKHGFVQLEWRGDVPLTIIDTIDYDLDHDPDFSVFVDRNNLKTIVNPFNKTVEDISVSTQTSYGWALRVNLRR